MDLQRIVPVLVNLRGARQPEIGLLTGESQRSEIVLLDARGNEVDRLKAPMKKSNGKWTEISWDDALALIADNLRNIKVQHGASSLAVYHGQTYLKNNLAMFSMKRFLSLFGTPNLCSAASECFIPQLLNGITTFGGLAMPDIENSRCVIIWGANPFASGSLEGCNTRSIRVLKSLKERGVQFIVVDPRTPDIAQLADVFRIPSALNCVKAMTASSWISSEE